MSSVQINSLPQKRQQQLEVLFWIGAIGLLSYQFLWAETDSWLSNFGAALITIAALIPAYLWCSGRAPGMPIFPLFALTFISTYANPLISNTPTILAYQPESRLEASITTAGFLVLGAYIWFQFLKPPILPPKIYRALSPQKGEGFFLNILGLATILNMAIRGGWLTSLPNDLLNVTILSVLGLTSLGTFVLAYRQGTQELSQQKVQLFCCLLLAYMLTSAIALLLVTATATFVIAVAAYVIGRRRIPILVILITFILLSFLHYGKGDMRGKYWFSGQSSFIQPWDYPSFFGEWIGYSLNYLQKSPQQQKSEEKQSFGDRSSVIQMLLLAQTESPKHVPYLYGQTYAILPQLLIPRFLNSSKISSHEGTSLLNIHYRLQTREDTLGTTIGWGLLAESYANFGILGCAGLAVVLGTSYGAVTRWSIGLPILSTQSLLAITLLSFAFQSEFSAGVYVAALFQAILVIAVIVVIFMQPYRLPSN